VEENKTTYEKTLVVPLEFAMWKALRRISYETGISMSKLTRESIEKVIKKYDKSIAS
jgi:hypothetical protein